MKKVVIMILVGIFILGACGNDNVDADAKDIQELVENNELFNEHGYNKVTRLEIKNGDLLIEMSSNKFGTTLTSTDFENFAALYEILIDKYGDSYNEISFIAVMEDKKKEERIAALMMMYNSDDRKVYADAGDVEFPGTYNYSTEYIINPAALEIESYDENQIYLFDYGLRKDSTVTQAADSLWNESCQMYGWDPSK